MKILIMTIKLGGGHYSASLSLREQIQSQFPDAIIQIKDICEYMLPNYYQKIYRAYDLFVNKGSKIYNFLYNYSEKKEVDFKPLVPESFLTKMDELIRDFKPEVIISTCSISSQIVSTYKATYNHSIPFITCITDITDHPSWINPFTDYYLVATPSVKRELIEKGINPAMIYINGIPVREEFNVECRHSDSVIKHLLIMGGSLGMLPKRQSFYKHLNELHNVETLILAGHNEKLIHKLQGKYEHIQVIGYTDKVYEYMKEADLIISKPGGLTLFESIYSEVPILTFEPALAQEMKNQHFIIDHQIGEVLDQNYEENIEHISKLLHDEQTLNTFRYNMHQLKNELNNKQVEDILLSIQHSAQEAKEASE